MIFDKDFRLATATFPPQFLKEFFQILQIGNSAFLTCNDLPFSHPTAPINHEELGKIYKQEFTAWTKTADKSTAHFLILHDCDTNHEATIEIAEMERAMGIVSTLSTYACWPWLPSGPCLFPMDFEELKHLQEAGFCIAYHCNAANHNDVSDAFVYRAFDNDIDLLLSKGLDIRFYSAHGGPPNAAGANNYSYFYPEHAKHTLISTHNTYGIIAHAYASDGGLLLESRKVTGDIRKFLIEKYTLGGRHKILLHPQYYVATDASVAQNYFTTPWIKEYWDLYEAGKSSLYWKEAIHSVVRKQAQANN